MLPGLGDPHLANPDDAQEQQQELSSDSGHERVSSKWAQSVVSVARFHDGDCDSIHTVCMGIVFDSTKPRAHLLTPLNLLRSGDNDRVINYNTKIEVRLPDNEVVRGIPMFHDSERNLAVVRIMPKGGGLRAASLDHHDQLQLEPHSQLVAVRRCFSSGKLLATTGMLRGDPTGASREQAATEGLLVDSLGNIVGLNCYAKEGTTFIPRSTILEFVAGFRKALAERRARAADFRRRFASWHELPVKMFGMQRRAIKFKAWSPSHMSGLEARSRMEKNKQSACHYCDPEGQSAPGDRFNRLFPGHSWPAYGDDARNDAARSNLRSRGYPFPVTDDYGMRLLCDFEEEFCEDVWGNLTEEVASDMSQSVVALASFSGDKRFFACTGIVIGCNEFTTRVLTSASLVRNSDDEAKVADDLKIEVCLPDNQHATGTLQHYNLRFNIAVINIMGSRCTQTAKIYDQLQSEGCGEVVAIGRVYESGKLIATGGTLIDKPSELDCKELKMSTCKITKAGIGGPLIDCDGNFIGMDFYGLEKTPYLPRNLVLEVLTSFDAKYDASDYINEHNPNRWPVPKPCWCYPTWHQYMGDGVDDLLPQPMWA